MVNAIISVVLLMAFFVVSWQLKKVQHQLYEIQRNNEKSNFSLASINEMLIDCINQSKEREVNTIQVLNEICQVLNTSFEIAGVYMNNTSFALENIAACMIPFIDDIKKCAIENDNYEKAQECIKIINNLKKIIESPQP